MVLTGQPNPDAHDAMLRITGLPHDQFEAIYWADRHAYDEGKLTGLRFWQNFVRDVKLKLYQRATPTAILSNMGDTVLANMEREFDWLPRFDVLIWSFQHKMAKPDPAIYRLTLDRLPAHAPQTTT